MLIPKKPFELTTDFPANKRSKPIWISVRQLPFNKIAPLRIESKVLYGIEYSTRHSDWYLDEKLLILESQIFKSKLANERKF